MDEPIHDISFTAIVQAVEIDAPTVCCGGVIDYGLSAGRLRIFLIVPLSILAKVEASIKERLPYITSDLCLKPRPYGFV
jgi:hypothetical protein